MNKKIKYLTLVLVVVIILISGCGEKEIPVVSTEKAICRASCSIDDPRMQFCSASDECYIPFEQKVKIFTECSNCEYGAVGCQACSTIKKGNTLIFDCTTNRDTSPKLKAGTYKLNTQATCTGNTLEIEYKETEETPAPNTEAVETPIENEGIVPTDIDTEIDIESSTIPTSTTCTGPIIGTWSLNDAFINYQSLSQITGTPTEREIRTFKSDCTWSVKFPERPDQDTTGTYSIKGNEVYITGKIFGTEVTFGYIWTVSGANGNILRLRMITEPAQSEGSYSEYIK